METLVHWFSRICHNIFRRRERFFYFHDSASGTQRRAFGSVSSEDFCGKGDSIMYCGKYHSDSVYLVIYQADFQSAEKDKDFQRIDHKIGRPCDEKK